MYIYLETARGTAALFEVLPQKSPPASCLYIYVRRHVPIQAIIFPLPLLLAKCSCEERKTTYIGKE